MLLECVKRIPSKEWVHDEKCWKVSISDYDYVIVNDDVTTAGNQLRSVIQAERRKSILAAVRQEVDAILATFKDRR